jgi:S-adenosylmethionine decarboxylase
MTRLGTEWLVECSGCDANALRDVNVLRTLVDRLIREVDLHVVGEPLWHKFPEPGGGVTGLYLLSESHVSCHTFPEHGTASFNLYCCRERPAWPWRERLAEAIGAESVSVREIKREAP